MQLNPQGRIITFYSYKGGVGRTMSLVNVAWVLASNGMKVLLVDWDLEAPGLHRYMRPFLQDPDLTSTRGLIDLLTDFTVEAMTPDQDAPPDWYIACADVTKYAIKINRQFPAGGSLELLGVGKMGQGYAAKVNSFDWAAFYERFGGGAFLETVKARMRAQYDYILIDSRAGVSDMSGICTVQMPDDLVVCFPMKSRGIEGGAGVASSAAGQRQGSSLLNPLRIFPVPCRVERAELDSHHHALESAKKLFGNLTQHIQDERAYWNDVSVPYIPHFAFDEIPAALTGDDASNELLEAATRLASYLTDGKMGRPAPSPDDEPANISTRYKEETR